MIEEKIWPMKKSNELDVRGTLVRVIKIGGDDYVCLTDMAKLKKLNGLSIQQMRILSEVEGRKYLRR